MIALVLLPFMFGNFVEKWYLPQGTIGGNGRVCIGDTDRDGHTELFFTTLSDYFKIFIYELHLPDTWEVDSFYCAWDWDPILWDIGDFDLDGLWDLVIQTAVDNPPKHMISITESPDSFSYPTQEVWRDTVGPSGLIPVSVFDVDRDGVAEIFKLGWLKEDTISRSLAIYEATSNNQYDTIFMFAPPSGFHSTIAFGDFDIDGQNEFVMGTLEGRYNVFECIGNNLYEEVTYQYLNTGNIKDCFTVPDADRDGRLEFVLKGFSPAAGRIETFFFEAVGNDTYTIIDSFIFYNGHPFYSGGHSTAGDVDGDGIPEIILEACQNIYIIKAAGNDSFYVWETLPGHNTGSNVRVFDFDNNGLAEIVISGNNETKIYEYRPGGVKEQYAAPQLNVSLVCSPTLTTAITMIKYTLPQKTKVSLNLYDNLGRLVKKIFAGKKPAGIYSGRLSLHDQPNGVYHLLLQTPKKIITRKVIKIKYNK
jgi:hypothetical protein